MNKAGRWKGRQKGKKKNQKQDSRRPWPERAPAGSRAPFSTPTFPLPPRPENCSLCSHAAAHQLCHGTELGVVWHRGRGGARGPPSRPLGVRRRSLAVRQAAFTPQEGMHPSAQLEHRAPRPRSCPRGRVAPPREERHSPHPRS